MTKFYDYLRLVGLPLTLLLKLNVNKEWFEVWSAYPYSSFDQIRNRFFLSNFSLEHPQQITPIITDLYGLKVTGAFIHYPPYTAYYHVVSHLYIVDPYFLNFW